MTHVFQPLAGGFRAPWDGLPPPPRQHAPQADATLQAAVFAGKPAWAAYSESIINSQSSAYTTIWSDQHKVILHPSSDTTARTFTIDSNANVPYPLGAELVFVNQDSAGVLTIAIEPAQPAIGRSPQTVSPGPASSRRRSGSSMGLG